MIAALSGCADDVTPRFDGGSRLDLGFQDFGSPDLGPTDLGTPDLGSPDLGPADLGPPPDLGPRCAPEPTGDTRWAQYPMPGTRGHPRSYQVAGTTVVDCVTGLEWQRDAPPGTYTPAEAVAYCDGLTLSGYTDWRLPSRIELITLVDYSVAPPGPTIDVTAFSGTERDLFWCASPLAAADPSSPPSWWLVGFAAGSTHASFASSDYRARCVRGNDTVSLATGAPPGHFTDHGDGTVSDNLTGLLWQQGFSPATQNQAASSTYCASLTLAGGGWRLPEIAELQTLVDEAVWLPPIDTAYFPTTAADYFWSASSLAGSPSAGWAVDGVWGAYDAYDRVSDSYRARCVR